MFLKIKGMHVTSILRNQLYNLVDYKRVEHFIPNMEVQNNNNNLVEESSSEEVYDEVDSSNSRGSGERREAVSGSTQTDAFDTVDCRGSGVRESLRNGSMSNGRSGHEGNAN